MPKFIVGAREELFEAMHAAGIIDSDPSSIARVVIDLKVGEPAMLYVQQFADSKLVDVFLNHEGLTVAEAEPTPEPEPLNPARRRA